MITLEEFTPPALQSMTASGVLASYPYRCAAPAYGATGFLIASRLRLTGCQVRSVFVYRQWAFVRIDHVLAGAHLTVTDIAAKPGFGSDHRYLIAKIAIRT